LSNLFCVAAGLPYGELRIKATWRVVQAAYEQFENAGATDPEHLEEMRRLQLDVGMHLAKVEDGTQASTPKGLPGEACATTSRRRRIRFPRRHWPSGSEFAARSP
jgi:hypothetical protein